MAHPLRRLFTWHLIFCVVYYWLRPLLLDRSAEAWQSLFAPPALALSLISFLIFFGFAYFPYLALRKTYTGPVWQTALALLGSTVAAVGVRYLIEEVVAPLTVGFRNYAAGTPLSVYYLDNLYYVVLHGLIGVAAFLVEDATRRERERQQLEVEKQRTELAFLRGQLNPHFLFNTLNNAYSLSFTGSPDAPRVLERLTGLLRYSLYEPAERVALRREVDYLLDFIELERLRLPHELSLDLHLPPDAEMQRLLPPLLLITFLENLFKHGDLRPPVSVHLSVTEDRLDYRVSNALAPRKQKDAVGGIGLRNLRRRLELLYADDYTLTARQHDGTYTAHLQIPLP